MTATKRSQAGASPQPVTAMIEELYRSHGLGLVRLVLLLTGDQATAERARKVLAQLNGDPAAGYGA